MTFEVQFSPHALRSFRKFNPDTKERIRRAIEELRRTPSSGPSTKRLKGLLRDDYRYRVGDYRILYAVSHKTHHIFIDYIQHRKDVYRDIRH